MSITLFGALKKDDNAMSVGWQYVNIVLAAPTTTVVKASPGMLHAITINTPVATGVVTVYDNTVGSGAKIATFTTASTQPQTVLYDVVFNVGLTIVTSTAAQDITVSYI